jgi:polyhydroxyalkanoate synthesis regulator phasin
MNKNLMSVFTSQIKSVTDALEAKLGQIVQEVNNSLQNLYQNLNHLGGSLSMLSLQMNTVTDLLIEKGHLNRQQLEDRLQSTIERLQKEQEEQMKEMQKAQEAVEHMQNNAELEESFGDACGCNQCDTCESEEAIYGGCCGTCCSAEESCSSDTVLASEKSNVVTFPSKDEE